MLAQLESVSLSRRDLATAFSWSIVNRFADVACLGFAAYAAGYHASIGGLTVACAAARAVGTIPLMPGGLLVVEAVLVPGLASSGMPLSGAISTMLIYRLISWLLLAAIGWVVFFFMFRSENEVDPDADNDAETSNASTAEAAAVELPGDALQGPVPPPDPAAKALRKPRRTTT
jgi:putative heme transporter